MFESELLVPNKTGKLLSIWVEPWAFNWEIPEGATCRFFGDSEIEGEFELVEKGDELQIFGWSGCNLKIYLDDVLELVEDLRAPVVEGMSTKSMIEMLFLNDP